ncbi:ABC transporter permease [Streptacidiphilus sp. P02-A3a]|uniref:ABC transporter permease n=1 Tax=Streptacidiphilus sp. P02-A3a TaxID=2704468 RepID=UPI0015F8E579|nr:ABC transporter permease [Streptacidiphilus sp. P02-A3a]QMU70094.1 ABC transporter permease [Streptacidiphilus sp. P02-A3a]QMU70453.1 ABC transporter permease [Streptacidiphilus sp. P02-A3a]
MRRFLLRRLLLAVPTLFGVTVVVFATVALVPGDPVGAFLGPGAPPAARRELAARLGLDRPLPVRYASWLWHALHGDLGTSISAQRPVLGLLAPAFGQTLLLAGAAFALVLAGGVLVGGLGAIRPGGPGGRLSGALSTLFVSAPQYCVSLLLIAVFAVHWQWLPAGGTHDPFGDGGTGDLLRHLVLPAVAAALVPLGLTARVLRAALATVLGGELADSLRARGLSRSAVLRHCLHNASPALLTIGGLQLAYLLEGVVFVETLFSWPGVGQLLYTALSARDLPVIEGGVLVAAVGFVGVNIAVDTAHALVDPRVRG